MSNAKGVENFKKVVLIFSMVLFTGSLTQNFMVTNGSEEGPGITALIFGWLGIIVLNPPAFCWLANPVLFITWGYFKKGKLSLSLVLSIGATLLALCFLLFGSIVDNEGGASQPITGYRAGYWLWLLSIVTMMIGNSLIYVLKKQIDHTNPKVISQS